MAGLAGELILILPGFYDARVDDPYLDLYSM